MALWQFFHFRVAIYAFTVAAWVDVGLKEPLAALWNHIWSEFSHFENIRKTTLPKKTKKNNICTVVYVSTNNYNLFIEIS